MSTWQPTKQRDGRGRFTANDGSALQAVPAETVQTARRRAMETTMPEKKPLMQGRKTYAGVIGTVAVALSRPLLLKYLPQDLATVVAEWFGEEAYAGAVVAAGAFTAWARKVAKPRVEIVDNRP